MRHQRLMSRLLLAAVLGSAVATVAVAAAPPPELRKVHALVVVDTRSGLGDSVKVDGERIDHLLSNRLPRDRAEIRVLTGKDVNAEAILAYYRSLRIGSDDALFFYYAGHGATDPQQGHFLALQELKSTPLLRDDLRRAMLAHQPGLAVLMTDCCGTRFKLPGRARRIYTDEGTAATIDPVLKCLLYQARGVVDITAASGNDAFGDDHDGGIFTRTFDRLVRGGIAPLESDGDGFVSWTEFFGRLQRETEGTFVTWAQHRRALGEEVDQTSQKPYAFALGGNGGPHLIRLHNETGKMLVYEYRWAGQTQWESARITPGGAGQHFPPPSRGLAEPTLEVRFEGGKTGELHPGKTYRFHDTAKTQGAEEAHPGRQ
jgi:Caspase domain